MRKGFILVFAACVSMLFWNTGCTDKKPAVITPAADTATADTAAADTLSQLVAEEPQMPMAADELFDDFIFNFAGSKRLQLKRIQFPLKVINGKKETTIQKGNWRMERFFMRQGYYTLIFDSRKQMNVVKDTSINNVTVEKIYLDRKTVKKYNFERMNGQWTLTSMVTNAMYQNTNASFLAFYEKFATDSTFQIESLNNPVQFSGPDPDDDFGVMTGEIAPETWPAFAPKLPAECIYNIMYGQKYSEGNQKIFVLRGISNGMEMELTFKRIDGEWKLMKLAE